MSLPPFCFRFCVLRQTLRCDVLCVVGCTERVQTVLLLVLSFLGWVGCWVVFTGRLNSFYTGPFVPVSSPHALVAIQCLFDVTCCGVGCVAERHVSDVLEPYDVRESRPERAGVDVHVRRVHRPIGMAPAERVRLGTARAAAPQRRAVLRFSADGSARLCCGCGACVLCSARRPVAVCWR